MKLTKKALVLLLAGMIALGATACDSKDSSSSDSTAKESSAVDSTVSDSSASGSDGTFEGTVQVGPLTIENGIVIECDEKATGEVVIPEGVTEIGTEAFRYQNELTSVVIPDSVTTIGENAFYSCRGLKSVVIPDSVTTIGEDAFNGCDSLKSIEIPASVSVIGEGAFLYSDNLYKISVDEENNNYCSEDGILFNKDKTALVCYPSGKLGHKYTIPDTVTKIGKLAFAYNPFISVVDIPDSVTVIDEFAFAGCWLITDIDLPEGLEALCYVRFMVPDLEVLKFPTELQKSRKKRFNHVFILQT